jgi:hypothetical protein
MALDLSSSRSGRKNRNQTMVPNCAVLGNADRSSFDTLWNRTEECSLNAVSARRSQSASANVVLWTISKQMLAVGFARTQERTNVAAQGAYS